MLSTTEETQNYRKAFHSYYYSKIQNDLEEFEGARQPALTKYRLLVALSGIIFCCAFGVIFYLPPHTGKEGGDIVKMICIIGGAVFYWAHCVKKAFEKKVKQGVINSFLSFFGDFRWSMDEHLEREELEASGLTGYITTVKGDDYFEGSHDDIGITISEVELIRGMGRDETKIFEGVFIKLDMNKTIKSHTIITENLSLGSKFCSSMPCSFNGMEKVELEDPDFNNQFDVFSQDQVEARYILTTSFMERFKHLKEIFNTNHIRASFKDNSVLIAISSSKDLFVLGDVTKPVTDTQEVQTLFEEFAAVLSLIEVLKLNLKLGL